jgi:hypothetical protein
VGLLHSATVVALSVPVLLDSPAIVALGLLGTGPVVALSVWRRVVSWWRIIARWRIVGWWWIVIGWWHGKAEGDTRSPSPSAATPSPTTSTPPPAASPPAAMPATAAPTTSVPATAATPATSMPAAATGVGCRNWECGNSYEGGNCQPV